MCRVYLNVHTRKETNMYVKSGNRAHTRTLETDAAGPSCYVMSCEPAFLFYV